MQLNAVEYKEQIEVNTATVIHFLQKDAKLHNGKKMESSANDVQKTRKVRQRKGPILSS